MSRLIAIDPGVHHCGLAVFDHALLSNAMVVKADHKRSLIASLDFATDVFSNTRVVIEQMTTTGNRARRGRTNDLLDVSVMIGRIYEWAAHRDGRPELVAIQKWKGQATKSVTRERCLAMLSENELEFVDLPKDKKHQTDVWDAVGIGLWALKR